MPYIKTNKRNCFWFFYSFNLSTIVVFLHLPPSLWFSCSLPFSSYFDVSSHFAERREAIWVYCWHRITEMWHETTKPLFIYFFRLLLSALFSSIHLKAFITLRMILFWRRSIEETDEMRILCLRWAICNGG